jgi:hypothetical protein
MTLERDDDVEWPAAVGDPVALAISQLIAAVIEVTPTDCKRASRPQKALPTVRCSSAACGGG